MATATLPPRRKAIADLLDKGLTPQQVAKRLKITRNAVYQQKRRIEEARGLRPSRRQSGRRARVTPQPADVQAKVTPLQAIRARKGEIEAELRESRKAVGEAERIHRRLHDAHDKLGQRHDEELRNLTTAEAALSGKSHGGQRVVRRRGAAPRRRASRPSPNGGQSRKGAKAAAQAAS